MVDGHTTFLYMHLHNFYISKTTVTLGGFAIPTYRTSFVRKIIITCYSTSSDTHR